MSLLCILDASEKKKEKELSQADNNVAFLKKIAVTLTEQYLEDDVKSKTSVLLRCFLYFFFIFELIIHQKMTVLDL